MADEQETPYYAPGVPSSISFIIQFSYSIESLRWTEPAHQSRDGIERHTIYSEPVCMRHCSTAKILSRHAAALCHGSVLLLEAVA
jgi:hypothetical protein